jgi:hypothetical protein
MEEKELPLLSPEEWLKRIEDPSLGEILPNVLDGFIPPWVRGRAYSFGALTGDGKTVFGLQQWRFWLDMGVDAKYITAEMAPPDLFDRLKDQFDSEEEAKEWIIDKKAVISQSYVDWNEIEKIIRMEPAAVVIDHIHELPFEGAEDLGRKVTRLAKLAPATNTCILMLAQVKQPDPLGSGTPTRYDFSWSKRIPEVSSAAMILHKEDPDSEYIDLHIVKNRFGGRYDPVSLYLDPKTVTFQRI